MHVVHHSSYMFSQIGTGLPPLTKKTPGVWISSDGRVHHYIDARIAELNPYDLPLNPGRLPFPDMVGGEDGLPIPEPPEFPNHGGNSGHSTSADGGGVGADHGGGGGPHPGPGGVGLLGAGAVGAGRVIQIDPGDGPVQVGQNDPGDGP